MIRLLKVSLLLAATSQTAAALADTQTPSIVNGLSATAISDSSVRVTWNRPWDDVGVHGYNVYRNDNYFATVFDTSYIDTSVSRGNNYRYGIVAFDQARNYTPVSSTVAVTPGGNSSQPAPPPPEPESNSRPGAPEGLRADVLNGNQARIHWSAVGGNVAGYNVYRDNDYRATVRSTDYLDSSMSWGRDYRYQIVAFTDNQQFSEKSTDLVVNTANGSGGGAQQVSLQTQPQNDPSTSVDSPRSGAPDGYRMVFSDEFNGYNIDNNKWNTRYRWGPNWIINGERQYYIDFLNNPDFGHSPFEFNGEHLTINAIRTPEHLRSSSNWQPYLSGALTTYNKFRMRYGYVEMRARLPRGRGLWSAFWLLHQHDNDRRPEIDVVELIGDRPNIAYNTYHYYENWNLRSTPSYEAPGPDYSQDFHTYGMLWEPGRIVWYVDGVERNRYENGNVSWEDMYLLVNLAVGGSWPGDPDGNTPFPARYTIDYIRAYQR